MEKEFVCRYCHKKFPSGKSLGGHIRIHTMANSVDSDSSNGTKKKKNNNKRQREITQQQQQPSLKALEGEKMGMDNQSATETTTSSGPTLKRSKKQSSSESFSSSSDSETDDQAVKDLLLISMRRKGYNLAESSENNSEIQLSSGELLKTDKVAAADDNMRSPTVDDEDDSDTTDDSDSYSSGSDYFMNGPKKSDSDISVGGSLRNIEVGSGFNSFKSGDDLGVKEGGSKPELHNSKRVSPSYGSDSYADTSSKIHKSSDIKSSMVKKAGGANKSSKGHVCPVCFKVFSSGQALGGHKRSHNTASKEDRIKHKAADMQFDLNLPAEDSDE